MIDLNTLRYFTSAFETRTFSQAARVNGVSQPTVSAAIQKLEDKLRAPLFQRSKSGLTPTQLAHRLYHEAEESVTHLSTLETRLLDQPQHMVRVHCAPDILIQRITPGLSSLRRSFGSLIFSFTENAQDCDLAYLSDQCVPEGHTFLKLTEEPFCVAVNRTHPLAVLSGIRLGDLQETPLIHRPYCPNADRMEIGLTQMAIGAHAANDMQLLDLIAAGLGVAFVPQSHGDGRDDITLLPLLEADAGTRRVGISHRKSAFAKGLAERLIFT